MTTAIRYKKVLNTTGAALAPAGISDKSDGNDKQYRIITRTLAAADIGAGPGQTQHAQGCIVDQLPPGTNVLSIKGLTYRLGVLLDNTPWGTATQFTGALTGIAQIAYSVNALNQVIVHDATALATLQLAADDEVIIKLIIGPSS